MGLKNKNKKVRINSKATAATVIMSIVAVLLIATTGSILFNKKTIKKELVKISDLTCEVKHETPCGLHLHKCSGGPQGLEFRCVTDLPIFTAIID